MNRKRKKFLVLIAVLAVLHFAASFISANKVGAVAGDIVANRIQLPEEALQSSEGAREWMEKKTRESSGYWLPALKILHGFPIGWIMAPMTEALGRDLVNQVISVQSLTTEQFTVRLWAIGLTQMFLNSVAFGMFIIAGWVLIRKVLNRT